MDLPTSPPNNSISKLQYRWPAMLREELSIEESTFRAGEIFTIYAPRQEDGSIDLPLIVDVEPSSHAGFRYRVRADKFDIGSRHLDQSALHRMIVPPTNLAEWDRGGSTKAGEEIQVEEPFGELFLNLAKGLKSNAVLLASLGCHGDVMGMLEYRFREVFMAIYSSIPLEHKTVLSQPIIDLWQLRPIIAYNQWAHDRSPAIKAMLEDSLLYLSLTQSHLWEDTQTGSNDPQSGAGLEFVQTGNHFDYNFFDPNLIGIPWYEHTSPRQGANTIVLCRLPHSHRAVPLIAEQLFLILFSCIERGTEETATAPLNVFNDAKMQIFRNIREAAWAESDHKPTFVQTPLEGTWSNPFGCHAHNHEHWMCREMADRHIFCLNKPSIAARRRSQPDRWDASVFDIGRGESLKVLLPDIMGHMVAMWESRIMVTIEVMKDPRTPHPSALTLSAALDNMPTFFEAHSVGIHLHGMRPLDDDGTYRQMFRYWAEAEQSEDCAIIIDGVPIEIPDLYRACIVIRNTLLKQAYKHKSRVDRRLFPRNVTVFEMRYRVLDRRTDYILKSRQFDDCLLIPSVAHPRG